MMPDNAQSSSEQGLTSEQSQDALLNLLEDLQKDKEDIKLQRRAMLNIAEDALKAREELAKNNLELEVLGGLITSERERFLDLLEKVGGAILIFEASRYIRSINPLMQAVLGKDRAVAKLEEALEILQSRFKVQGTASEKSMDLRLIIDKVLSEPQTSYQTEAQVDNKYFQVFIIPMSDWQTKDMGGAIVLRDITTLK